jgi:hypothetical protein
MKKKILTIALTLLMLAAGLTYAFTGSATGYLMKDCPKKGTADCSYTQETASADEVPECCKKK